MAPTANEPSLARAADELAELLSEGALQDVLILQRLPGLRTVLESAGLRLMSFCQCFPERFSLMFLPEWGLRVSLAPASSEPALDLPLVENMLEAAIVQHVERYHDKHSANRKAPAAPMAWIVRRTGPELDAYIAHAARRHLHFQLDPEASGFANLRLALRGCVASHVRDFVHARSEVLSWVEGPPCDGGTHASCHCQGAVALTPEHAATVMAARRARLQAEEAKREARREAREARRAKEEAAMEEQPDGWREDVELTPAELLAACTEGGAGGTLLLMRGPARSASLFAEELRAAARHVALPPALLRPLCRGLWLLPPPAAGDAAGGAAHAALRALLPSLGGVRLAVTLLAAARGDDADALVAAAAALPRRRAHWSLELEQHFPAAGVPLYSVLASLVRASCIPRACVRACLVRAWCVYGACVVRAWCVHERASSSGASPRGRRAQPALRAPRWRGAARPPPRPRVGRRLRDGAGEGGRGRLRAAAHQAAPPAVRGGRRVASP